MSNFFIQAFIYLVSSVIIVPLAKRFGLGSVLGYLIAGVIIGPVIGLAGQETASIQHVAEFGVVMMLFLVGLELEPKILWQMRTRLLGLGGLQMLLTTTVTTMIAHNMFSQKITVSLAIGFILSLSSTAIVLQTLNEKKLTKTDGGKNAFSVLLFQDIAVIPILAILPLLSLPELVAKTQAAVVHISENTQELSILTNMPGWAYTIIIIAVMTGLVIFGHSLSGPLFKFVAQSGVREIFTATALMIVIGVTALMNMINLSPALGTFLAGVVLANSEFKHELEANIEPFKGLLLGLFFITVGAGINFEILWKNLGIVFLITILVIVVKTMVLLTLSVIFKIKWSNRWLFSLALAQAGEFGFVLLSFTTQHNVLPIHITQILNLVVALSMFLTPGLFILYDKITDVKFKDKDVLNEKKEDLIEEHGPVIIAGIGRFGQVVNRLLQANNIPTVILDSMPLRIDLMKKIKVKSYFGDPSRPEILIKAGIENAKLLVVAIDDKEKGIKLVKYVHQNYSNVKILARAYDQAHLYALKQAGANVVVNETYHSALVLGAETLREMGYSTIRAERIKRSFMKIDLENRNLLYETWKKSNDGDRYSGHYRDLFLELENAMSVKLKEESETE